MRTLRNTVRATAGLVALCGLLSRPVVAQAQVYTNLPAAPYDAQCYLMAHNSYVNPDHGYDSMWLNQSQTVWQMLMDGVRCINLDVWMVKQKKVALTYHLKVWDKNDHKWKTPDAAFADPVSINWNNVTPEIVTAHEPLKWGYGLLKGLGSDYFVGKVWDPTTWGDYKESKYPSLVKDLRDIEYFVRQVSGEVVTLRMESYIEDPAALQKCFDDAGLTKYIFWADRDNPGCWVDKPGCPASEKVPWNVQKHGWPTISQMTMWRKNCVVLTDFASDGMPYERSLLVRSPEPDKCFSPTKVFVPDHNSEPLNDLTHSLFSMTWHIETPLNNGSNLANVNSYLSIGNFWQKVLWPNASCGRVPNFLEVDFYERGAFGGPRKAQQYFNQAWAALPNPHCYIWTSTPPNANGWNNKDANCGIIGYGGALISHISADPVGHDGQTIDPAYHTLAYMHGQEYSDPDSFTISKEGVTRIAYFVRNAYNMQSNLRFAVIYLDKTAPHTSAVSQRRTVWLNALDNLSGVDKIYYNVDGGPEQVYTAPLQFQDTAPHVIGYRSKDKADNYEVRHFLPLS